MSAIIGAPAPVLAVVDGIPTTTSNEVASFFGKRHDNVMQAIQNLLAELPESSRLNFQETEETRPSPLNGAPIKSPAYRLTRDGFTLLAMGFTGKKALAFKFAYIDAFNKMEAELRAPAQPSPPQPKIAERLLPEAQAAEIMTLLDRLGCLFHPFSDPFADVLGIARALRGLNPRLGMEQPGYVRVVRLQEQNATYTTVAPFNPIQRTEK